MGDVFRQLDFCFDGFAVGFFKDLYCFDDKVVFVCGKMRVVATKAELCLERFDLQYIVEIDFSHQGIYFMKSIFSFTEDFEGKVDFARSLKNCHGDILAISRKKSSLECFISVQSS